MSGNRLRNVSYLISVLLLIMAVFVVMRDRLLEMPAAEIPEPNETQALTDEPETSFFLRILSEEYPTAVGIYDLLYAEPVRIPDSAETQPPLPPVIPDGGQPILLQDLSGGQTPQSLSVINETSYLPGLSELISSDLRIDLSTEAFSPEGEKEYPVVLILHTHGSEAYTPEGIGYTTDTQTFHTDDITQNVVSVGKVLAETLRENGISTVHCTIMHDLTHSYSGAYPAAAETILSYLAEYPTIRYVLDVHRDALLTNEGQYIKPLTYTGNDPAAQIMFVIGTDQNGANHPYWKKNNLTVAAKLQSRLISVCPGICRPVNLRKSSFNEQHAPGSMLVEIGTNANTLSEAKRSAALLGKELSALIRELAGNP